MKAKKIYEILDFERGKDPKDAMDMGMVSKYGEMYSLFVKIHNLSLNSPNFTYTTDIKKDEENNPYFIIESVFFYTDEDENKIPEQFSVTLYEESILVHNLIINEESVIYNEEQFIKATDCFDSEDDGGWDRTFESLNFERGRDPKSSMGIGKVADIINKWNELQQTPGTGTINLIYVKVANELVLEIYVSYMPGSHNKGISNMEKTFGWEYFLDSYNNGPNVNFIIKPEYEDLFTKAFNKIYSEFEPFVKESLDFERGQDPKTSMNIGAVKMKENIKHDLMNDSLFSDHGPFGDEDLLYYSISKGKIEYVKFLLDLGIDPSKYSEYSKILSKAAVQGDFELLKMILDAGKNWTKKEVEDAWHNASMKSVTYPNEPERLKILEYINEYSRKLYGK